MDTFEVHAEQLQQRGTTDEPGLDTDRMTIECRVVKSPSGKPLKLPEQFRAGDPLPFTFNNSPGEGELLSTPDSQHPTVAKKLGQKFRVLWEAKG